MDGSIRELRWSDEQELVMYGRSCAEVDEQLPTSGGPVPCTIYPVPEAWYTAAFMALYDLLYGPNAPVNARFPRLQLAVDGAIQPGNTLAILGLHKLWEQGDPVFHGSFFFHFPMFYELKANMLDLQLGMGLLMKKHLGLLPKKEG